MHRSANGGTHRGWRDLTGRMLRVTAIGTVAVLLVAGTAGAITPVDAGDAGGTTIRSTTLPATRSTRTLTAISPPTPTRNQGAVHYYDFATGIDHAVPRGTVSADTLSDVSGSRIAMARQTGLSRQVVVYDTALGTSVEIDPPTENGPFATAIAGTTVAFADGISTRTPRFRSPT